MSGTKKFFLFTTLVAALPLTAVTLGRWAQGEFSAIPEKRMWIDGRDTRAGAIVRWPQKGVATILSPKFTIAFEGESWAEITLVKAQYQVDGRYGGLFPPDSQPLVEEMGNGVLYSYSARQRETTISFKKHRFVYCDYKNTLQAGGKTYSTAGDPVHLWVGKSSIRHLKG